MNAWGTGVWASTAWSTGSWDFSKLSYISVMFSHYVSKKISSMQYQIKVSYYDYIHSVDDVSVSVKKVLCYKIYTTSIEHIRVDKVKATRRYSNIT